LSAGKELVYTYDFGDNWEHFFTVKGRAPASFSFECLGGSGHYVAEDVGSWREWEALKQAYRAAQPTKEQREKREWFEAQATNSDPRGLAGDRVNFFDKDQTNRDLDDMLDRFERMGEEADAQRQRGWNG